jgi:hypothetical protein
LPFPFLLGGCSAGGDAGGGVAKSGGEVVRGFGEAQDGKVMEWYCSGGLFWNCRFGSVIERERELLEKRKEEWRGALCVGKKGGGQIYT